MSHSQSPENLSYAILNIRSALQVIASISESMSQFGHSQASEMAEAQEKLQEAIRIIAAHGLGVGLAISPIPGVLWPWATDGNTEHDWIERDDEADIYPHDDAAAYALGAALGREVKCGWIESLGRYAPYIDKEE